MTTRDQIIGEVEEELKKDSKTMLVDIYSEILNKFRPIHENQIHAEKRLALFLIKNLDETSKIHQQILKMAVTTKNLTLVISFLTGIVAWLTYLLYRHGP